MLWMSICFFAIFTGLTLLTRLPLLMAAPP
jgi:hypothetical protein